VGRLQREGDGRRLYLGDAFLIWQRQGDAGGPVQHRSCSWNWSFGSTKSTTCCRSSNRPSPSLSTHSQLLSLLPELIGTTPASTDGLIEMD
jgi:hypothetical protein